MGRVGHFQLTLNNPGLSYKESGPSAPVTRHPPQPRNPAHTPGAKDAPPPRSRHPTSGPALLCAPGGRPGQGLPPSAGARGARGQATHPHKGLSPSLTRADGGWGPGQPPQPLPGTEGLGSQTDLLQSPCPLEIPPFKIKVLPWVVWFSGLSASLRTKGSPVRIPVGTHAWVAGRVPMGGGNVRGNHMLMFFSLSFSLPSPLSKNK